MNQIFKIITLGFVASLLTLTVGCSHTGAGPDRSAASTKEEGDDFVPYRDAFLNSERIVE